MKHVTFILAILVLLACSPSELRAEDPVVRIDSITENVSIRGRVANLEEPEQYKILVYVKTDQWYIHPYAGQGEGRSWARIEEDGSWKISTVKHQFTANAVGALVVEAETAKEAPSPVQNLESIAHHALIWYDREEMEKESWYGSL